MSVAIPESGTSPFDALRRIRPDGSEYWSARELMPFLGYMQWRRFAEAVEQARAVVAAEQGEHATDQAFCRYRQEQTGGAPREDYELSRYAAYLTAMRADSRKPEIRAALIYFAVRTREAETRPAPVEMTKLEALRAAIESEEGRLAAESRALQAERQVAELEPSARSWGVLASTHGDFSLRDAAHILNRDPNINTGQQRLMKTIRLFGMIDGRGIPYAKHSAHLVERPQTYKHPHTGEETLAKPQIRVTVHGLRYLHKKLGGVAPLRFEQLELRDAG